jgi:hypothetical protein
MLVNQVLEWSDRAQGRRRRRAAASEGGQVNFKSLSLRRQNLKEGFQVCVKKALF